MADPVNMNSAINKGIESLGKIEKEYNDKAGEATTDLAGLMKLQAGLSLLGMKMQACTATVDKIISTQQQAAQKIMQS
ncbi:hypothetical protein NQT62_03650 [Limnobacter humi]|uniref:Uncharacterized protein n=1 Tax=Limnobacter humi TaxID=1778671 RepID=A0ABT1WDG4_9BURK|nr:hypothetical protein [Limnobacter humi]MCQ8895535.1 hypothetical protein [Limnobacter humi]